MVNLITDVLPKVTGGNEDLARVMFTRALANDISNIPVGGPIARATAALAPYAEWLAPLAAGAATGYGTYHAFGHQADPENNIPVIPRYGTRAGSPAPATALTPAPTQTSISTPSGNLTRGSTQDPSSIFGALASPGSGSTASVLSPDVAGVYTNQKIGEYLAGRQSAAPVGNAVSGTTQPQAPVQQQAVSTGAANVKSGKKRQADAKAQNVKADPNVYNPDAPALTAAEYNALTAGGNPDWHDAGNALNQGYAPEDTFTQAQRAVNGTDTSMAEANAIVNQMAKQDAASKYQALLDMYGIGPDGQYTTGSPGLGGVNAQAAQDYYNNFSPVQDVPAEELYKALAGLYGW